DRRRDRARPPRPALDVAVTHLGQRGAHTGILPLAVAQPPVGPIDTRVTPALATTVVGGAALPLDAADEDAGAGGIDDVLQARALQQLLTADRLAGEGHTTSLHALVVQAHDEGSLIRLV